MTTPPSTLTKTTQPATAQCGLNQTQTCRAKSETPHVPPVGMTTNEPENPNPDPSIDPLLPPVRQLLAFYDDLLAGNNPPITQLDSAICAIQVTPLPPGQHGEDITLIANGGKGAPRTQIVDALERLRTLTDEHNDQPAATSSPADLETGSDGDQP